MVGTLLNAGMIAAGSLVGMMIRSRLPEKMVGIIFQGLGLFTMAIGIAMSLRSDNLILAVISIVSGAVIGQWIDLDRHLKRFSEFLQHKLPGRKRRAATDGDSGRLTEGFVTATMLFCIGAMSILGPIEDGLGKTPNILFTKSILDGISSVALAASFGAGILFSSVPVLFYQGAITLCAVFVSRWMSEAMIADLTAVGGILLIGMGINILKIKRINITNMLPALVIVVLLSYFWG